MSNYVLHGIVGALIASTPVKWEYATTLVVVAAVGKELYDRRHGGHFNSKDVLATVAGAVPVISIRYTW